MSTFKEFQPLLRPPWLLGPNGQAVSDGTAAPKDELVELARQAVKARMPMLAPADAVALLGRERGITPAVGESTASFAARIRAAWGAWSQAGAPMGLLAALKAAGYADAHLLVAKALDFSLNASGNVVCAALPPGGWNIDNDPTRWARFQVLLPKMAVLAADGSVDRFGCFSPLAYHDDGGGSPDPALEGMPNAPAGEQWVLKVTYEGPPGDAGFDLSKDGGATWLGEAVPPPSGICALDEIWPVDTGIIVNLAPGSFGVFVSPDSWSWTVRRAFPTPTSPEALTLAAIVRAWTPAFATCEGIVVHVAGALAGWPRRTVAQFGRATTSAHPPFHVTWST